MPLSSLLPIRAITIRLRLSHSISPPFFHHAQLAILLNELLHNSKLSEQKKGLWFEAQESGRTTFGRNDEYYLNLFCIPSAYPLFIELLDKIRRLPNSFPLQSKLESVFSNKFRYAGLTDYFTQKPVKSHHDFISYDERTFQDELVFWQQQTSFCLRLLSPTQLKRSSKGKGKNPFVCDRGFLESGDIESKALQALTRLSPELKAHYSSFNNNCADVLDRLFWQGLGL